MVRRGIFGLLAALPFGTMRAQPACGEACVTMNLSFTASDLNAAQAEILRSFGPIMPRLPMLLPGERLHVQPILHGDPDLAPFGWDTLENVR